VTRVPLPPSPWAFDPDQWPDDDCVAVGADLQSGTVIEAYRCGAFPMPHEGELLWWSPTRRGVLVPADIRISRSLARSVRRFTVTVDESFADVVDACADPSRPGSWIDADIRDAYVRLHELGWAHSIETRTSDGTLVGGLYGLSIGALFAGESMFHHATDASKVALVELARRVGDEGLIDTQWSTPHLASLGVTEWSREAYLDRISSLVDASPPAGWD
jgi:leucyl/phenylalanyl-tRNA--protein transferase